MKSFEDILKEILILSNVLCRREFKACLFEYYISKIKDLTILIKNRNCKIVENFQLKFFEPILQHLRTTKNSSDKCKLIEYLLDILKITQVTDVNVFFRLYLLMFSQLFDNDQLKYSLPEELKIIVLKAGGCLIKKSTLHVLESIYMQESAEKFSLGISVSVKLAKEEKSFTLRREALDFLLIASQFDKKEEYSSKFYTQVGDLFILYLPGTIAPLQEFILRDEIQHHVLTIKALTCWGHILCLTLNDFSSDKESSENEILKNWMHFSQVSQKEVTEILNVNKALLERKKTRKWLKAAAHTLGPLIVKITELRKHSNPKCRLELVKVMGMLLENCAKNLEAFLPSVVEVLISCCFDENKEVCLLAKKGFSKFEIRQKNSNLKTFNSIIENNLFLLLNKLPRIVLLRNEEMLLLSLKSLSGYLGILGKSERLKMLLCFSSSLKKLMMVLQISFKLEIYPAISDQEFSDWDEDYNSTKWLKCWKHFQFFENPFIKQELEGICKLLGQYGEAETIIDYLLEFYYNDQKSKKELLIILNQILLGVSNMQNHMINRLIDFYLESENLNLSLEINEKKCLNLKETQYNIIMVALTLEGIGNLAENLKSRIQNYLLKILYCVVEHIGSLFTVIKSEALKAGVAISKACGLGGNICLLLKNNMDYLIYHLTVELRKNNRRALDVLMVIINNSSFEALLNLEDTIRSVLQISSKNFDSPFTMTYLCLLKTFVSNISKCIQPKEEKLKVSNIQESEIDELQAYVKSRQQGLGLEQIVEGKHINEILNPEEYEEVSKQKETHKSPRYIELIVSISSHCLHFLASKDKNKNLVVLEILNESVFLLAEWENYLLPIVHKIWSPLTTKFQQMTDPLIINRSFTLLCNLARTSKNFIRSRTLKSILPALLSFLSNEARQSKLKTASSGYHFSQSYKLQSELLKNLGLLATNLGLFEKQLDLLVESLLIYLNTLQPKELQELCLKLFLHLKTYDSYLIWLKLHYLHDNFDYAKNKNVILNNVPEIT